MAIIALKAWYLEQYEPIKTLIKKPHHLRLSRNSLLKTGMRADFLDDRTNVEASDWFARYLEGEMVEFYIEGSGTYLIANIDLVSQEIYFAKQETFAKFEPIIYFSPQTAYPAAAQATIENLNNTLANLNERSRIPLSLEITPRSEDSPLRLSDNQLKRIRKSLLFIADGTPIATVKQEDKPQLILDSNVCLELGYALEHKDRGQMLLLRMERLDLTGAFPFDVSGYKQLDFSRGNDLAKTLPKMMDILLQRFNLFS
jgi:hypothetical protein